jgi:hypothetical protein
VARDKPQVSFGGLLVQVILGTTHKSRKKLRKGTEKECALEDKEKQREEEESQRETKGQRDGETIGL